MAARERREKQGGAQNKGSLPALRGDAVTPLAAYVRKKAKGPHPKGPWTAPSPAARRARSCAAVSLEDPAAGPQEGSRTGCGVTRSPLPSSAASC